MSDGNRQRDLEGATDVGTTATDAPPRYAAGGREVIAAPAGTWFGHPRGLGTLFFTEMWERFSYYGLRPLLILFMTATVANGGYGFDRDQASAIVGIYAAFVYLMSLPGGWVADRWLGLRRAIFIGACLISAGHISIGLSGLAPAGEGKTPFFLGLILIVLGTGLLKPNISAIVGDLYPEGGARRDAGFSIFYMGINFGSLLGQTIAGILGERVDWHVGMGAAGVAMLFGLTVFGLTARKTLGNIGVEPTKHPDPAVQARQERKVKLTVVGSLALLALVFVLAASGVFTIDAQLMGGYMTALMIGMALVFFAFVFAFGHLTTDEKKRIAVIIVLFLFAAIFWSAFEQAPTSLNLFAADFTARVLDTSWIPDGLRAPGLWLGGALFLWSIAWFVRSLVVPHGTERLRWKELLGVLTGSLILLSLGALAGRDTFEIPATWFQSVNPLMIIIFAPVFAALWLHLARHGGDLSSPTKFSLGLALAGVGFVVMIFAANRVVASGGSLLVSPWWLVWSYFFQSIGELCLSPVGLSSMTKLSPRKYVGQMMGIWFLASALGNLIGGLVGGHVDPENLQQMPRLFIATTASLFIAAVILALLIVPIRRMMATQQNPAGAHH